MREGLPTFIEPMLLKAGARLPEPGDDRFAVELKYDGIRAQIRVDCGRVTVRSRPGRDCTEQFPELLAIADAVDGEALLDGELVVLDPHDLQPDFARIASRLTARSGRAVERLRRANPAVFVAWDVLHLGGRSTRMLPYSERRAQLQALQLRGPHCQAPVHLVGEAHELLAVASHHHLEGIVVKRLDSRYEPGRRTGAWCKHKALRVERLTAVRYVPPRGSQPAGVLVARRSPDGALVPVQVVHLGVVGQTARIVRTALVAGDRGDVDVAGHGRPGRPLRDAVLRGIATSAAETAQAA